MTEVSRRTVLAAGAAAAAVTAIGANSGIAFARNAPTGGSSFVNIVAHTDDDLLFLNPDIQPAILAGIPVRTIVLGADEFNGVDELGWSREDLAASVQEGSRSAYAVLAGLPNEWSRDVVPVEGTDLVVEIDTLDGAEHVQVVYLSLPDGGDDLRKDALKKLWEDPNFVTDTIVPTGSPVPQQWYNQNDLNTVLLSLLREFQPTMIRMQDPYPNNNLNGLGEHDDHIYTSLFAQRAVKAYEGPDGRKFALLTRYRCYNAESSPLNVSDALLDRKTAGYQAYQAHDPVTGDRFDVNLPRNYQRWPVVQPWAITDSTGRLHAFAVAGDSVMWWHQAVSGAWEGPVNLKAGTFAPGVAVALAGNGLLRLAVLDLDTGGIITTTQAAPGGGFLDTWTNVGNPDGTSPAYGTPGFGVSDGIVELFVVNRNDELSRGRFNGTPFAWSPAPVTNAAVMSPPVAITAPSGRMHVFCDANGSLAHWHQDPQQPLSLKPLPTNESTHAPGLALDAQKVRALVREHTDGAAGTLVENTPNGTFSGLVHLGGAGGHGPLAAVTAGGPPGTTPGVIAFARNSSFGISTARQNGSGFGPWEDLGGYAEVGPAAVRDANGLVRVLVVGGDAKLYERKQTAAGVGGAFGPWQQAGN